MRGSEPQASPPRVCRLHAAALVVVLLTLGACAFYWWRLVASQEQLRAETLAQAERGAGQLAEAVAAQVTAVVGGADFALRHLRDEYAAAPAAFEAHVRPNLETFPPDLLLQVGAIDADGYLAYSSLGAGERVYLGDREHFRVHADSAEDRLFISRPVLGRVSRAWSIQLTRPIRRQGRFAGVMVVSLAPEYISRSFAGLQLGPEDVVALFRPDGAYLARSRDQADALGKSVPADRPFLGLNVPLRGSFRVAAAFDQVRRTYAWRRLDGLPLTVTVGLGDAAILGPLEEAIVASRRRNGIAVALVLLLGASIAVLLVRSARQQRALAAGEARYRSFFEKNASVKLLIDPADGRIVDANPAAVAFYGYPRETLLALRIADINCLPPEEVQREMGRARAEQRTYFNFPHRLASGEIRQVEVYSGPMEVDGRPLLFSIVHDITARRDLEAKLRDSEELHRTVFEAAGEGILVTDSDNRILAVNPAFTGITGYRAEEVIGRNPSLLASGQQDGAFYRALWQRLLRDGQWEGEINNRRKDGQIYVEWLKITAIRDEHGRARRYVALFSDVTARKRREESVWRQANFDTLTGLPNRKLLEDRLQRAIVQARRRHSHVAVLFVDLDRFKPVNDRYGHAAGDDLLRQVARRLENCLRDEDTIARLGGDELVVVLPDLRVAEAPAKAAEKIIAVLSEPFRVGEHFVEISCSIGVALFPQDADNAVALIGRADAAMYRAKQAGRATWQNAWPGRASTGEEGK